MTDNNQSASRPLSPHIQIYKWQITNTMSILHRISGVALVPALKMIIMWLMVLAVGEKEYNMFVTMCGHPIAQAVIIGFIFCFFFYTFHNIRHLFWDFDKGFELPQVRSSAWMIVYGSVFCTVALGGVLFILGSGLS